MRLPGKYAGDVGVRLLTGDIGTFRGSIVPVAQRVPRVGDQVHQATHETFLPQSVPLPIHEAFWLTWKGRVYIPVSDTRSLVPQAQLWQAHLIDRDSFAQHQRVTTLVFPTLGALVTDVATGNKRPALGTPLAIQARLATTVDPKVMEIVGADSASLTFIGRWGTMQDPRGIPAGISYGSQCPLVIEGQPGTLTVLLAWPDDDLRTEQLFGARWLGIWRVKKT